jgi:hypothetical protein
MAWVQIAAVVSRHCGSKLTGNGKSLEYNPFQVPGDGNAMIIAEPTVTGRSRRSLALRPRNSRNR